jgi:DUF2075 family protein
LRETAPRWTSYSPPATLWAHDPGGLGQVGCIYTAQGFEFDYRVLLTRGLVGCYVCFLDKETERFVRSRMERR